MFKGIGGMFSGSGLVRSPFYANGGIPTRRGMRNRRSSHREQAKRAKAKAFRLAQEAMEDAFEFEGQD